MDVDEVERERGCSAAHLMHANESTSEEEKVDHQRLLHLFAIALSVLLLTSACTPLSAVTSTPVGSPTVPPPASISGTILLESGDPFLWIYAHEVTSGEVYSINPEAGARTYTIPDLPAGTYVVVGWFKPMGASGAYSSLDTVIAEGVDQMRACEEAIVYVELEPGEEYIGADIGCWGGDFFDWTEPGANKPTPVAHAVPAASATELADLVGGNTAFAFNLYQALRTEKDGNLFYSPYSISLALAMAYAGARGETERQMADSLHFGLPQERLHLAFSALAQELDRRGEGAGGMDGQGFRLNVVNALWGQEDYRFLSDFLDLLAASYGAEMRRLDFAREEKARRAINDWVSQQTEGRIQQLIARGTLDPMTRLVLTNAVYFNAAWARQFDPRATRDGTFHLLAGSSVLVPMMHQQASLAYAEGVDYQAVELPYAGYELAMVILLPAQGQFESFENALDAGRVQAILESLAGRQVALTFPRFDVESGFRLGTALAAMGMPLAFTLQADFSGMTPEGGLFISDVIHRATISVDEAGTEAAAATAVVMPPSAMPANPVTVAIDRPFLFLIRDLQIGTVLFVGRVVDPSALVEE